MSNIDECPICLEDNNDFNNIIFECKHVFHYDCYIQWIKFNNNSNICPSCNVFREISTISDPTIYSKDNEIIEYYDNNVVKIKNKKKCLGCIIL